MPGTTVQGLPPSTTVTSPQSVSAMPGTTVQGLPCSSTTVTSPQSVSAMPGSTVQGLPCSSTPAAVAVSPQQTPLVDYGPEDEEEGDELADYQGEV